MARKWTEDEILELKRLCRNSKLSPSKIAKKLNRTRSSIYNQTFLIGIKIEGRLRTYFEEPSLIKKINQFKNKPIYQTQKEMFPNVPYGVIWRAVFKARFGHAYRP